MRRRQVTAPSNESVAVVPVFAPDPHGAAMFSGVINGTLGHLGSRPVLPAGDGKWHGWLTDPQAKMTGAGNLGGSGRPVVAPTDTLDRQAAYVPDNIQAVFAQRAAERRLT